MWLMIFSVSIFIFIFTLVFFGGTIKKDIIKRHQLRSLNEGRKYLDDELEKNFAKRFIIPSWKKTTRWFSNLADRSYGSAGKKNEKIELMEKELRLAGIKMAANEFRLLRMVFIIMLIALGFSGIYFLSKDIMIRFLILIFILLATVAIPRYFLKARIKNRQLEIQNQLPNVMDVLSVSIEAGLGFDAALQKVIDRFEGPLIDELNQVYREIQMGRSRRDVLTALGKRSNVTELQTFASAVVQSEQYGSPIKNVLKTQSKQLRVSRKQAAQEKGMKATIKMMLPMVMLIFPVIFIILLGPTVINMIGQFG